MKKNNLAPIAIFVYKRFKLLKILINSLKKNNLSRNSSVFIFSDGWKNNDDKKDVLKVRKYLSRISGFKKVFIILRSKNFGVSRNIIDGINAVLQKNNKIIILEEDLELSKYFLEFVNHGLKIYQNDKKIASVNAWSYPFKNKKNIPETFFIRGADCWGWGTWKRSWIKFNPDGKKLLYQIELQNLKKLFNFNNSYNFFKMLEDQTKGKNDSWAIRWYASMFLENMYTLYPKISLVNNTGTKDGTHSKFDILNLGKQFTEQKFYSFKKQKVKENLVVKKRIVEFLNKNYFWKIKEFIKNYIINIF
jgi:hypothetical protein